MIANRLHDGLDASRTADNFTFVIFGVTGDLTRKKLIPALYSLFAKGQLARFSVIGFARRPWDRGKMRQEAAGMLEGLESGRDGESLRAAFLENLDYIQSSFEDPAGYQELGRRCAGRAGRLFYLSTPPDAYAAIIENLGRSGLVDGPGGSSRIVVEKPIGRDLQSARELNLLLSRHFSEEQIFRIDHYLGKETVQNIMLLRFGNGVFEPIWNSRYVHHVQISVAEKIGVGTRGNYYQSAGALRDMVQNHMLQLLSLTAMEPPTSLAADAIRGEKVKVLNALRPITHKNASSLTVRGQYSAGFIDGAPVAGFAGEPGIPADSRTESFVALKVHLDTWRWAGVPFYLRTGKRLSRRVSEIAVQFKDAPLRLFARPGNASNRNMLIIRIQPEEGITFNMNAKIPGHASLMRPVNMDFAYGSVFGESAPEAYERLLLDALVGDSTLYTRRDEIEASWTFITRILKGWENDPTPLPPYAPGSSGPEQAKALLEDAKWRKL